MLRLQEKNWFIGLASILTIVLALLNFFDIIDWSLWWVFAPLWLPITIQLVVNAILVQINKRKR